MCACALGLSYRNRGNDRLLFRFVSLRLLARNYIGKPPIDLDASSYMDGWINLGNERFYCSVLNE